MNGLSESMVCSRSHGQPSGARSLATMAIRRSNSLEAGVMGYLVIWLLEARGSLRLRPHSTLNYGPGEFNDHSDAHHPGTNRTQLAAFWITDARPVFHCLRRVAG